MPAFGQFAGFLDAWDSTAPLLGNQRVKDW